MSRAKLAWTLPWREKVGVSPIRLDLIYRTSLNSKATHGIMRGRTVYSLTPLRLWECVMFYIAFDGGMDWPPFGLVDETMIVQVVLQVVS